jgi:hypothetical protein
MDWMAPESLQKEKHQGKIKKNRTKTGHFAKTTRAKIQGKRFKTHYPSFQTEPASADDSAMDMADDTIATGEVDVTNALDLSDSEAEEEQEGLIEDFAQMAGLDKVCHHKFTWPDHSLFCHRIQLSTKIDCSSSNSRARFPCFFQKNQRPFRQTWECQVQVQFRKKYPSQQMPNSVLTQGLHELPWYPLKVRKLNRNPRSMGSLVSLRFTRAVPSGCV